MTDTGETPVSPPTPEAAAPADKSSAGFFRTRNGKIVLGVIGVLVLLGVVGALAAILMFSGVVSSIIPSLAPLPTKAPTAAATTGSVEATIVIANPPEVPLTSSFTFRNVFAPTIKAPHPASAETSSSSETTAGSGSTSSPDTLYLIDIITSSGTKQAVFVWNNETYTVSEGETVGTSPWKVLSIGTDSVLMLYGDSQVTLTVGQGITK